MANTLKSSIGTVYVLAKTARIIRDSAFTKLVESIRDDRDYLAMRGIIVWRVPEVIPLAEGEKSPFVGQEGKLVVLGGNQRFKALLALGEKTLDDRYLIEAKDTDGNWVSPEVAERIVLKDNNPEGLAGENDYKKMFDNFSQVGMKLSGIDFSAFREMMDAASAGIGKKTDPQQEASDRAEKSEFGEKNDALQEFIAHREDSRRDLAEIDEAGFYLTLAFDSVEQKLEFVTKAGLAAPDENDEGPVVVNTQTYIVLVFETYAQKMDFCEKFGISEDPPDADSPRLVYGMFCDGRAFAAKMGIPLAESGLHFRDQRVDSQLASLAREDEPQATEAEYGEALRAALIQDAAEKQKQ